MSALKKQEPTPGVSTPKANSAEKRAISVLQKKPETDKDVQEKESNHNSPSAFSPKEGPLTSEQRKHIRTFVLKINQMSLEEIKNEYAQLKSFVPNEIGIDCMKTNALKNRYKDVFCWDRSRVKLTFLTEENGDYIHANHVKNDNLANKIICTQGPLDSTQLDFWRMCFQEHVRLIVMLCQCVEGNNKPKCAPYWPAIKGQQLEFGPLTVTNLDSRSNGDIHTSRLALRHENATRFIEHRQWVTWPDKGIPPSSHLAFKLCACIKKAGSAPVVIHCSAGVGRTGTLALLEIAEQCLLKLKPCQLLPLAKELRNHRSQSVQTEAQYVFLHFAFVQYAVWRKILRIEDVQKFLDLYENYAKSIPKFTFPPKKDSDLHTIIPELYNNIFENGDHPISVEAINEIKEKKKEKEKLEGSGKAKGKKRSRVKMSCEVFGSAKKFEESGKRLKKRPKEENGKKEKKEDEKKEEVNDKGKDEKDKEKNKKDLEKLKEGGLEMNEKDKEVVEKEQKEKEAKERDTKEKDEKEAKVKEKDVREKEGKDKDNLVKVKGSKDSTANKKGSKENVYKEKGSKGGKKDKDHKEESSNGVNDKDKDQNFNLLPKEHKDHKLGKKRSKEAIKKENKDSKPKDQKEEPSSGATDKERKHVSTGSAKVYGKFRPFKSKAKTPAQSAVNRRKKSSNVFAKGEKVEKAKESKKTTPPPLQEPLIPKADELNIEDAIVKDKEPPLAAPSIPAPARVPSPANTNPPKIPQSPIKNQPPVDLSKKIPTGLKPSKEFVTAEKMAATQKSPCKPGQSPCKPKPQDRTIKSTYF